MPRLTASPRRRQEEGVCGVECIRVVVTAVLFWTSRSHGKFSFTGYHRDTCEGRKCCGVTANDGARGSGKGNATPFDIWRTRGATRPENAADTVE